MNLTELTGRERTRQRVRGLVLAHGLAAGSITVRELSPSQRLLTEWAVQSCITDALALNVMQEEAEVEYGAVD